MDTMIRFRLQELLAEKQFMDGRRVTLTEVAAATGINRVTLSRMSNVRGYSTVTENLNRLCAYFGCRLDQLAEYVPDSEIKPKRQTSGKSR
jgi:putative transcriptional regulator